MKYSLLILFPLCFFWFLTQPQAFNKEVPIVIEDPLIKKVFLFAGFVGCEEVCPRNVAQMSQTIEEINQNNIGFYFLNLTPTSDSSAEKYSKIFHPDFKSLKSSEAQEFITKFNLNTNSDTISPIHPPTWLYLQKENNSWRLKNINKDPKSPLELKKWVHRFIKEQ